MGLPVVDIANFAAGPENSQIHLKIQYGTVPKDAHGGMIWVLLADGALLILQRVEKTLSRYKSCTLQG